MPKISVDVAKLTFADMEDFEDHTGSGLLAVFESLSEGGMSKVRMKDLTALIWIVRRSEDPTYTIEQARQTSMADLADLEFAVEGTEDPTSGSE